jgi:hypothetical protein
LELLDLVNFSLLAAAVVVVVLLLEPMVMVALGAVQVVIFTIQTHPLLLELSL